MKKTTVLAGLCIALVLASMPAANAGPRFSLGLGIGIGPVVPYRYYSYSPYPVPYYYYSYAYPYPYPYYRTYVGPGYYGGYWAQRYYGRGAVRRPAITRGYGSARSYHGR